MMTPSTLARRGLELSLALALCVIAANTLEAQRIPDLNAPRRAAEKAADATNANISAQTGQAVPAPRHPAPAPASGPGSAPQKGDVGFAPAGSGATTTVAGSLQPVTREVFAYEADDRRDPFFSLILTEELRPLLSDLKLVGILYDASGRRSVAVMRDVLTNAQYRVNAGASLGRMRVAQIKPHAVIFTIDEFGLSRQDSLFLSDTTRMRMP
jgi:hypothetical protein